MGTQETSCILIAGLLERDIFDLFLPEFDKPLVIHLRETCCYSTNLCTWRPNTIYKNRSVCRHQRPMTASLNNVQIGEERADDLTEGQGEEEADLGELQRAQCTPVAVERIRWPKLAEGADVFDGSRGGRLLSGVTDRD
jgi:hypothetical protein